MLSLWTLWSKVDAATSTRRRTARPACRRPRRARRAGSARRHGARLRSPSTRSTSRARARASTGSTRAPSDRGSPRPDLSLLGSSVAHRREARRNLVRRLPKTSPRAASRGFSSGHAAGVQVANVLPVLTSSGNAASDGSALQAAGARAGPAPPCELSPALATDWCGSAGHPVVASEAASGRPPLGCAFGGTPNRRRGPTEMDYDDA